MKYYLDTCVWIARLDDKHREHDNALKLFEKIEHERSIILVSESHIKETQNTGNYEKFERLKNELFHRGICIGVKKTEIDAEIAARHNEYLHKGFDDCLHLQIAKRLKAVAVSYDAHWFEIGQVIGIRVYKPEEIIT